MLERWVTCTRRAMVATETDSWCHEDRSKATQDPCRARYSEAPAKLLAGTFIKFLSLPPSPPPPSRPSGSQPRIQRASTGPRISEKNSRHDRYVLYMHSTSMRVDAAVDGAASGHCFYTACLAFYTVHGDSALSARCPDDGRLHYNSKTKMTLWCCLQLAPGSDGGAERAGTVSYGRQMLRYSPSTPPRSHCCVPRYMVCPSIGQHAAYMHVCGGGVGVWGGARQSRQMQDVLEGCSPVSNCVGSGRLYLLVDREEADKGCLLVLRSSFRFAPCTLWYSSSSIETRRSKRDTCTVRTRAPRVPAV